MNKQIDISWTAILKVVAVVLAVWLVFLIKDVLILLFVVLLLAVTLGPLVSRLTQYGLPRFLAILLVYLGLALLLAAIVYLLVPPLVIQLRELANNLPLFLNQATISYQSSTMATQNVLESISGQLSKISGGFLNATLALFGGVVSTLTVFALTFYFLIEEEGWKKTLLGLIPLDHKDWVIEMMQKIAVKLGFWLRGQLGLMVIVAILDSVGLAILKIPYALSLGILAGLLELIPIVGPIVAGLVAIIMTLVAGGAFWKVLVVVAIFILVQQLESQILVPKIMQKAVGLSPVIIIVAILIGYRLLGFGGAILAIPIAAALEVFVQEYSAFRKKNSAG